MARETDMFVVVVVVVVVVVAGVVCISCVSDVLGWWWWWWWWWQKLLLRGQKVVSDLRDSLFKLKLKTSVKASSSVESMAMTIDADIVNVFISENRGWSSAKGFVERFIYPSSVGGEERIWFFFLFYNGLWNQSLKTY
jgi:hypothetical protein